MFVSEEPCTAVYASCLPWPAFRLSDLHRTTLTGSSGLENKAGRTTFSDFRETSFNIPATYAFTEVLLNLHVLCLQARCPSNLCSAADSKSGLTRVRRAALQAGASRQRHLRQGKPCTMIAVSAELQEL